MIRGLSGLSGAEIDPPNLSPVHPKKISALLINRHIFSPSLWACLNISRAVRSGENP